MHASLLFLYEWYYFKCFYDVIALSFSPQVQEVKAVNSVKCVRLPCIQTVWEDLN